MTPLRCLILTLLLLGVHNKLLSFELENNFQSPEKIPFKYTFNDVSSINELLQSEVIWKHNFSGSLSSSSLNGRVWLEVSLDNKSNLELPVILSIGSNLLDNITAYIRSYPYQSSDPLDNNKHTLQIQSPIKHESQILTITLAPSSRTHIYIKVDHHGALNLPITLWQPVEYLDYESRLNLFYGTLAGFILAMAFINCALFYFTKRRYFLYGAILVGLIWLLNMHIYGFSYRYFYGDWQWLKLYAQPILVLLSCISFNGLLLTHLVKRALLKLLKRTIVYSTAVLISFLFACTLIEVEIAVLIAYCASIVFAILSAALIAYAMYKKILREYRQITIYCLLIFVLCYQLIYEFGLLSGTVLTLPIIYASYVLISLLVTHSFIVKYIVQHDSKLQRQQLKLAKIHANDAILNQKLHIQKQAQRDLESSIDERTFELQVTLRELEEKNRALEKLNMEDPLTKVKNRRYFDKRILMEIRRSRREQTELSVIMLDIDHFKKINDTYGHLNGDHAICAVAELIKEHLKRPHDEVFRYGGEEFVLLLPSTSPKGAMILAEQIRTKIESQSILLSDQAVNLTISAGVYSAIAVDTSKPELFTDFADKALYQAKQQGRNRTTLYETS